MVEGLQPLHHGRVDRREEGRNEGGPSHKGVEALRRRCSLADDRTGSCTNRHILFGTGRGRAKVPGGQAGEAEGARTYPDVDADCVYVPKLRQIKRRQQQQQHRVTMALHPLLVLSDAGFLRRRPCACVCGAGGGSELVRDLG